MSAYAAAASLKYLISFALRNYDVLLPPPTLRNYELVLKELESFLVFAERMDRKSRKMMEKSIVEIAEAIREAEEAFDASNVYEYFGAGEQLVDSLRRTKESMVGDGDRDGDGDGDGDSSSKSNVVGLREERSGLKESIVNLNLRKEVLIIFGMTGIGKTTLAREIFQDLDVSEWLDCSAWVTVGTEWNSEEVTRAILSQTGYKEKEEAVEEDMKQWLEGKRYLIVLDNVWNTSIGDSMTSYLVSSFPNNENGSRILITSSIKIRGSFGSFSRLEFEKRLLNKEESWPLLCEKVFGGGLCPPQLVEAGKKIADKCDGLHLTILTVADLLLKAEETPESLLIDVAEQMNHQLFTDAYDRISEVLYPIFEELRGFLKPCFLYMGVFPLKYEISSTKLTNLWIVEEIVEPSMASTLECSLESCAAVFLRLLDYSCLIKVHLDSTSSLFNLHPGIKTCSLHSSWWHFCQREARKTNFFYALDCYIDGVEEGIESQTRLSFHNNVLFALKDVYDSIEENCASTAQSLLCFGPYLQYMVHICFGLKLLVRLDALNIRLYDFPIEVLELVMLRYLALTCNGQLPPSVSKLGKLQYLIVHRHSSIKLCGVVSVFPKEIWDMKTLKYLEVEGSDLPNLGDAYLHNLSTLLDVSTSSCTVLNRVPNLKKLGITIELRPGDTDQLYYFHHISHLTNLEALKCVVVNPKWKFEIVSPVSSFRCLPFLLKKLSLSGMGYPWKEISSIASLPHLEILKLRCNAFRGPKWEVEENVFQKLHLLLMEDIDFVTLKWTSGSFRCLEILAIEHCYKLKELNLSNLPNIWRIKMVDNNPLVEKSIKENMACKKDLTPVHLDIHYSWKS